MSRSKSELKALEHGVEAPCECINCRLTRMENQVYSLHVRVQELELRVRPIPPSRAH